MKDTDKIREIINHIVGEPEYKNMCDTYGGKYAQDLYQEFILTIMQYKKPTKLFEIYQRNQLLYFCCTIIKNMGTSSTSPFYKKIRQFISLSNELKELPQLIDNTDYVEPIEICNVIDSLNDPLNQIDKWFKKKIKQNHRYNYQYQLFQLYYYENLSYREMEKNIEEMTGHKIKYVSLFYSLREVIDQMKKEITLNYH